MPTARWSDATAANLVLAYDLGLIAATGICLPSFYFYGLLAGLRISMLQVSTHATKCLATTAVVLVGILPFVRRAALGMIVFGDPGVVAAPDGRPGADAAVHRRIVGRAVALRGIHAALRHDPARSSGGADVLPPPADAGLGGVLLGRHPGDDPRAVEAFLRLKGRAGRSRSWDSA